MPLISVISTWTPETWQFPKFGESHQRCPKKTPARWVILKYADTTAPMALILLVVGREKAEL